MSDMKNGIAEQKRDLLVDLVKDTTDLMTTFDELMRNMVRKYGKTKVEEVFSNSDLINMGTIVLLLDVLTEKLIPSLTEAKDLSDGEQEARMTLVLTMMGKVTTGIVLFAKKMRGKDTEAALSLITATPETGVLDCFIKLEGQIASLKEKVNNHVADSIVAASN